MKLMRKHIISIIAATNYDSDARVVRSVRALTDAGISVDPILIRRLTPSSRVQQGSYGIKYTCIGPKRSWLSRPAAIARRSVKWAWGFVQSRRFKYWITRLLLFFSLVFVVLALAVGSFGLMVVAFVLVLVAWFVHSAVWIRSTRKIVNLVLSRLVQVDNGRNRGTDKELIAHLNRVGPDLVLMHDMVPLEYLSMIRENSTAQIVWDAHEFYPDVAGLLPQRSVKFHDLLLKVQHELDGLIVVNPMIQEVYHERYPAMPRSISMTNACRTPNLITYDGRLHEAAGIPRSKRVLLYQGGLSAHRGLERLSEVAQLLPPDWVVVVMGKGNLLPTLEKRAQSPAAISRDTPHTIFLPPAPHDELLMWTAGATLATIFYEPTCLNQRLASPNKIWEYAGAGVPVLVNDLPFIRSKIELYDSGWVVPVAATPNDLANLIGSLSTADLESKALSARAFAQAEDGKLEEEKLVEYLSDLLEHGP